jgi:signal transduction histidine kinase
MADLAHTVPERTTRRRQPFTRRLARPPSSGDYTLAAAALVLVVVAGATQGRGAGIGLLYAVAVAVPVGLGLLRLGAGREERFARLLIGAGALLALTSLAQSDDSALYTIGRISGWVLEPALVYLVLAFPSGRLTTRTQRRLAAATAVVAAVLYLPTALVAPFPEPSPWAVCGTDCPANAVAVTDAGGAIDAIRAIREVLTVGLFAAVAVVVLRRARTALPIIGRALVPVTAIALFRSLVMAFYLGSRAVGAESQAAEVLGAVYMLSLPALALAFAAASLVQRVFAGRALEELTHRLTPHAGSAGLRQAMAYALRDPSLRIVYWVQGNPGRWVDESGWPVAAPEEEEGLAVTEVAADGRRVAAILHDPELSRDPALIEAATSYALTALENERLARQLQTSIDEVHDSRARIVSAADAERRKIERDLHDGAQQRLVALRIKLALLAERVAPDSPEHAAYLHDLEYEVDATIEEVRSFARDIYPPLLAERGLREALRAAARGSAIPVTLDIPKLRRYPLELESTVYFACVEALQNVSKHAHGATSVWISVSENGRLRFSVRDNGSGFEGGARGTGAGMANIRDRLAAIGGTLEVDSTSGVGTTVTGTIPTG